MDVHVLQRSLLMHTAHIPPYNINTSHSYYSFTATYKLYLYDLIIVTDCTCQSIYYACLHAVSGRCTVCTRVLNCTHFREDIVSKWVCQWVGPSTNTSYLIGLQGREPLHMLHTLELPTCIAVIIALFTGTARWLYWVNPKGIQIKLYTCQPFALLHLTSYYCTCPVEVAWLYWWCHLLLPNQGCL